MSLINQMLQDLDARRGDMGGAGTLGQQVRAVPVRRGVHPAWWASLALGGLLIGVTAFFMLRPQPASVPAAATQLPLKLDIDLNALPSVQPEEQQAVMPVQNPVPAGDASAGSGTGSSAPQAQVAPAAAADLRSVETNAPAAKSVTPAIARPAAPLPRAADIIPAMNTVAPSLKASDTGTPSVINKQLKELTPAQRAENEYRKAVITLQQGKRVEAIPGLQHALQLDPRHAGARYALIGALIDARQGDEAMLQAREGLAADATQHGLAMILARLQVEKGELRPAIETLERTLPHASDKADYLAFLAALLQRDERHKQAVEQYLLAVQRAPQNGIWWMGLGISLQAERRIPDAVESFKRAKATNSLSPELLAFVDARLGQLQQ